MDKATALNYLGFTKEVIANFVTYVSGFMLPNHEFDEITAVFKNNGLEFPTIELGPDGVNNWIVVKDLNQKGVCATYVVPGKIHTDVMELLENVFDEKITDLIERQANNPHKAIVEPLSDTEYRTQRGWFGPFSKLDEEAASIFAQPVFRSYLPDIQPGSHTDKRAEQMTDISNEAKRAIRRLGDVEAVVATFQNAEKMVSYALSRQGMLNVPLWRSLYNAAKVRRSDIAAHLHHGRHSELELLEAVELSKVLTTLRDITETLSVRKKVMQPQSQSSGGGFPNKSIGACER